MDVVALLHEFSRTIANTVDLWQTEIRTGVLYQSLVDLNQTLQTELAKGGKPGDGV